MNSSIKKISFLVAALILISVSKEFGITKHLFSFPQRISYTNSESDSIYKIGIKALQKRDTISAAIYFNESIRIYDDAKSIYELVKIQLRQRTFVSRNNAYDNLLKLVMMEPLNLTYRYAYADLCKDFSRSEAFSQYRKILELDSMQTEAWIQLAELKAKDFDEYNHSVRAADEFYFELQNFADDDFVEAEKYFSKVLSIDSFQRDATLQFALLYEKAGKYEKGIELLKKFLNHKKGEKEIHLALGLLLYKTSKLRECYEEYKVALAMMAPDEREDFTYNSVKFLLEPAFKDITDVYTEDELKDFIELYWKIFDPLYMTDYNERLLEHYSRVAYSNLHFSVPKIKIVGWKSNRGEVVLRYGEPMNRMRIRPSMEGNTVSMKTEVWNYHDMTFGFSDLASTGNYKFVAPPGGKDKAKPQFAGDSNYLIEYLRRARYSSYDPKFEGPKFEVPFYYSQFKNYEKRNHTDLYLCYALADADSMFPNKEKISGYDVGFSMFERNQFNELIRKNNSVEKLSSNIFEHDSLKTLHTQILKIASPSDSGYAAFEVMRRKDKGVFSNHGKFTIRKFSNNNLDISDIMLATRVNVGEPEKDLINRKEISILPKPDKIFSKNDPLFIYYEIYNLKKDADGYTSFDQKITVRKVEEKSDFQKTISAIGNILGLSREEKVTLTSHYKTAEGDSQIYLQLDLSKYEAGNYQINIEITDNLLNKTISSSIVADWRN